MREEIRLLQQGHENRIRPTLVEQPADETSTDTGKVFASASASKSQSSGAQLSDHDNSGRSGLSNVCINSAEDQADTFPPGT